MHKRVLNISPYSKMSSRFQVRSDNLLENIGFDTVLRCITILSEMLNLSVIKSLTSELRALLQDFVMVVYKVSLLFAFKNCVISRNSRTNQIDNLLNTFLTFF